jgi:hypothetical protein
MARKLIAEYTFVEYVQVGDDSDRIERRETGQVKVYDDYSIEWDYNTDMGNHYSHVKEAVRESEEMDEEDYTYTSIIGGSSIASGEDTMVMKEMVAKPWEFARGLKYSIKLPLRDDPKDMLRVREEEV